MTTAAHELAVFVPAAAYQHGYTGNVDFWEDYATCKDKEQKYEAMLIEIERLEQQNQELQQRNADLMT